jgi:hypothetical protein
MNIYRTTLIAALLTLACGSIASAQEEPSPNPAAAPPNMLVLVHQEFRFGKPGERQKLAAAISRACDHLHVPNDWIDLESITGSPEALSFDPFDSFEHVGAAFLEWGRIFATHPELARMQEEFKALVTSERTVIAVRRDDLSYRPQSIDLSKARFLRTLEVRLHPGYESEFAEAFKLIAEAYEKIKADTPWVVYHENVGASSPTFLILVPLHALKQNDDLLSWQRGLHEAEGEEGSSRLAQIAKDAYAATESNLYAVNPEMSHVSREFAEGDPDFWSPKPSPAAKPAPRKDSDAKPKP